MLEDNQKPISHPIVNYYVNEVAEDSNRCDDMDYEDCDYEASND
jgi:hypothetical protein